LVALGKLGSRAYCGGKLGEAAPFLREDTIETTGAGDTFCGCVLYYVLQHKLFGLSDENLLEMLTFANSAASLITTKKGALKVMPSREEIEAEIKRGKKVFDTPKD
ncbi:MAG: carbohydrate kinase family protein, partial [Lachnospiraceae bacterium]|nr:carbohydrate kinase family protein [Lachnospiraceae bacterium]